MRRTEVRAILKRHPGSVSAIAVNLGITITSVSQWLRGRMTSAKIEAACQQKAQSLLAQERRHAA